MATNHTTNYALNLWEPTDAFVREEFNENSEKIDAAIKAEADARAALAQTVNTKATTAALNTLRSETTAAIAAKPSVIIGTYKGNALNQGAVEGYQQINLGVRPRLVLVASEYSYGGQVSMVCGTANTNFSNLIITDTGFQVGSRGEATPNVNYPGYNYCYLAII